jgi:hypothetical protein
MTGVTLPVPSPDQTERQVQLKEAVTKVLLKYLVNLLSTKIVKDKHSSFR